MMDRASSIRSSLACTAPILSYTYAQDYGKFGVVDMDDKQKLFRLMKRLNAEPPSLASGSDRPAASSSSRRRAAGAQGQPQAGAA